MDLLETLADAMNPTNYGDIVWVIRNTYGEIVRVCKTEDKANQIVLTDYRGSDKYSVDKFLYE